MWFILWKCLPWSYWDKKYLHHIPSFKDKQFHLACKWIRWFGSGHPGPIPTATRRRTWSRRYRSWPLPRTGLPDTIRPCWTRRQSCTFCAAVWRRVDQRQSPALNCIAHVDCSACRWGENRVHPADGHTVARSIDRYPRWTNPELGWELQFPWYRPIDPRWRSTNNPEQTYSSTPSVAAWFDDNSICGRSLNH